MDSKVIVYDQLLILQAAGVRRLCPVSRIAFLCCLRTSWWRMMPLGSDFLGRLLRARPLTSLIGSRSKQAIRTSCWPLMGVPKHADSGSWQRCPTQWSCGCSSVASSSNDSRPNREFNIGVLTHIQAPI